MNYLSLLITNVYQAGNVHFFIRLELYVAVVIFIHKCFAGNFELVNTCTNCALRPFPKQINLVEQVYKTLRNLLSSIFFRG